METVVSCNSIFRISLGTRPDCITVAPRSRMPRHLSSDLTLTIPPKPSPPTHTRPPSKDTTPVRGPARKRQNAFPTDFKFPQAPPPEEAGDGGSGHPPKSASSVNNSSIPSETLYSKANGSGPVQSNSLAPATTITSTSTVNGSTRSSMEFCAMSNHSTETIESEYVSYPPHLARLPVRHRRHFSSLEPTGRRFNDQAQALLMGYAQINASFTVDGSLINHSLFEEVKRKGVVGTSGRGDPSTKAGKPGGGFFGNLGLGAISDSIGGLLSGGELEGLQKMRGVSSSQSIPLLSTPQSLLFVDLRLNPGEEKSFSFSFTLPKGLPASHRGKAIKISYNLVIGTQRAGDLREVQRVRRINIPFRVLSGVDGKSVASLFPGVLR